MRPRKFQEVGPVYTFNRKGELLSTYDDVYDCANALDVSVGQVIKCIEGKLKTTRQTAVSLSPGHGQVIKTINKLKQMA